MAMLMLLFSHRVKQHKINFRRKKMTRTIKAYGYEQAIEIAGKDWKYVRCLKVSMNGYAGEYLFEKK
jgi:hypothetical protein